MFVIDLNVYRNGFWRMNDRTYIKWLKSGLRTECEAWKLCSFNVLAVLETLLRSKQTSEFNNY